MGTSSRRWSTRSARSSYERIVDMDENEEGRDASSLATMTTNGRPQNSLNTNRNWWAFWILGTVNNLAFVVVMGASASMACKFNAINDIAAISWANVAVGVFVRLANTVFLLGVSETKRVLGASACFLVGMLGVAFAATCDTSTSEGVHPLFWVTILSIVVLGAACSFAESVFLGFLRKYPVNMTNAWSSGTGMAGVLGSSMYLGLHLAGMADGHVFFVLVPTIFVYWGTFRYMLVKPTAVDDPYNYVPAFKGPRARSSNDEDGGDLIEYANIKPVAERSARTSIDGPASTAGSSSAKPSGGIVSREQLVRAFKQTFHYGWQLAAVYFFEYVIQVTFAALAFGPQLKCDPSSATQSQFLDSSASSFNAAQNHTCEAHNKGWTCEMTGGCGDAYYCQPPGYLERNMFQILAFAYQIGVLMSRSSLSIVRVKRFWILTFIQGLNFALYFANSIWHFLPSWLLILSMVWVGLMGGAMYVNTFANLVDDPKIKNEDREVAINVVALWVNFGIVSSSLFGIISAHTFLPVTRDAR